LEYIELAVIVKLENNVVYKEGILNRESKIFPHNHIYILFCHIQQLKDVLIFHFYMYQICNKKKYIFSIEKIIVEYET